MATLQDIKKRITTVGKTHKITKTMEMVSTSHMKRWQNVVLSSRPYSEALTEVLLQLSSSPEARAHPLMKEREEVRKTAVILLTSNRGLCGAFNNHICKRAQMLSEKYKEDGIEAELYAVGKKGISYFNHLEIPLAYKDNTLTDGFSVEKSSEFTELVTGAYISGRVDRVEVVYNRFVSSGRQELTVEQLLPLTAPSGPAREALETDFIFEPSPAEIVNTLLPLFARSTVYRMFAENITSEHAARRKAMKQATDNAEEMITFLTRRFNRERQAQITKELSEIVGGAEAIA
ncbi:MAG: ATP synthase F1 subunit gamma [Gemmatimonadota bacterium]|nr:ATP synthase F1 subunit gamma [Gemmatimonadota bacterium]